MRACVCVCVCVCVSQSKEVQVVSTRDLQELEEGTQEDDQDEEWEVGIKSHASLCLPVHLHRFHHARFVVFVGSDTCQIPRTDFWVDGSLL